MGWKVKFTVNSIHFKAYYPTFQWFQPKPSQCLSPFYLHQASQHHRLFVVKGASPYYGRRPRPLWKAFCATRLYSGWHAPTASQLVISISSTLFDDVSFRDISFQTAICIWILTNATAGSLHSISVPSKLYSSKFRDQTPFLPPHRLRTFARAFQISAAQLINILVNPPNWLLNKGRLAWRTLHTQFELKEFSYLASDLKKSIVLD